MLCGVLSWASELSHIETPCEALPCVESAIDISVFLLVGGYGSSGAGGAPVQETEQVKRYWRRGWRVYRKRSCCNAAVSDTQDALNVKLSGPLCLSFGV